MRDASRERGIFTFSLDTELAWGALHRGGYAGREDDFERTRFVVRELLAMFENKRAGQISVYHRVVDFLSQVVLDRTAPIKRRRQSAA